MSNRKSTQLERVGLLLVASACSRGPAEGSSVAPAHPEPARPELGQATAPVEAEPTTGRAVVASGARLYFGSTGDAGIDVPPLAGAPGLAVDVVGEADGRWVIETLGWQPAEHHCAATMDGLDDVRLRLHVAKDELLPVLTTELDHVFGDETKVRLARGVPVPPGATALLVRGTPIRVPVPDHVLGRVYEPAPPFDENGSDGRLQSGGSNELLYGGERLAEEHLYRERTGVSSYGTAMRDRDALVTVRGPCLEVTARVSPLRLRRLEPHEGAGVMSEPPPGSDYFLASPHGSALGAGRDDEDAWGGLTGAEAGEAFGVGGLGLAATSRTWRVEAGAAIFWSDGRPAGQVTSRHAFTTAPREHDGLACFDAPLVAGHAATVALCFAPADVRAIEPTTSGRGFGGRGKASPLVRQAKATIVGSHDVDIVRRIVRAHINEVRSCYDAGLSRDASLAGEVTVQFSIDPTGKVTASSVVDSTLPDPSVAECIAAATKRWTFTTPPDGNVTIVTHPFVLEPG